MLLALAILAGGYASMEARAWQQPFAQASLVIPAPEDVHDHRHSHDLDGELDPAGHEHKHNPFDHTHDIPTAAIEGAVLAIPPPGHTPANRAEVLIPVPKPFPERPPRASGRS
jgi:hypothetical protein